MKFKMQDDFQPVDKIIETRDVLEVNPDRSLKKGSEFIKLLQEILSKSKEELAEKLSYRHISQIETDQEDELLFEVDIIKHKNSKGWQKLQIKFKISMEARLIEPETSEPESPLDDIRQSIQSN